FYNYGTSVLSPGLGNTRTLATSLTNTSSTGSSAGSSGSSTVTAAFTSGSSQIQTLKQGSLAKSLYAVATSTPGAAGGAQTLNAFTTLGVRRAPSYVTALGFDPPPAPPASVMVPQLRQMLDSSTILKSGRAIQIATRGQEIVLQGTVSSVRERRLAE